MSFVTKLDSLWRHVAVTTRESEQLMLRLRSEIDVAHRFATHRKELLDQWEGLIGRALKDFSDTLKDGKGSLVEAVTAAEDRLDQIGRELKKYTIHCCGHAHIDMNWLWPWQETVSATRDSFTTVDRLMDLFPDFKFSQDQASVYVAMEQYSPEIFEMIKRRIAEGRWDLTASTWVEGEKNLSSGEALCRQMLYTRRYFKEKFGIPYDAVKIDWEPDMFGHSRMLPAILNRGGVTRYYFCRAGKEPKLFWWKAPDGSRVLAFMDDELWYNGSIGPEMTNLLFRFEADTGLKDYMFMYGVGDHGGGPTRRDLLLFHQMQQWPIYPTLRLSKTSDFFDAVEAANPSLPVIDDELNTIFEGCYTSQSKVKRGNRRSESLLPKAEAIALIAGVTDSMPYPSEDLERGWRHTLLCQFHDILPGSGIHATYEYSEGLYQEVAAISESVITRGLRRLASRVDTASVAGAVPEDAEHSEIGAGTGAGAGKGDITSGSTSYNIGAPGAQPFLVYNSMGWARSEIAVAQVWNVDWPHGPVKAIGPDGESVSAQVLDHNQYWGHAYTTVAFPVEDVPSVGYKVYALDRDVEPQPCEGVHVHARKEVLYCPACELGQVTLENQHLSVTLESKAGAICHLVDKATGIDFVPQGEFMGLLEVFNEAHNPMSAWNIGQIRRVEKLDEGWTLDVRHRGPHRGAVVCRRSYNDSTLSLEISLDNDSRQVRFDLTVNWLERGTPEKGVPFLRTALPVAVSNPQSTYEIPFGSIQRPAHGQEVPALKWADVSGSTASGPAGLTLVNESKYGHNADGSTLRLSLLRSSYAPDPLPEMGEHRISWAVQPHTGAFSVSEAMKAGWNFNDPLTVISTAVHSGDLPPARSFASVEPANVVMAALKKAEDSDGIVVRLFECEGHDTDASVSLDGLVRQGSSATEMDILEQPLEASAAQMDGTTLKVKVPAYGIATVRVE
ncbi:MAG: alpha-mannosidase [Armatimonadetes bacterium]|nr:alpha-mannosidase [Armatimonadota bacterium]